jgi:hypothetical protein
MLSGVRQLPSFSDVGMSVYSDTDEDGILLYIFALIGTTNRQLVDMGASSLKGSNSANLLLHHGWSGSLIDADETATSITEQFYKRHPATKVHGPKVLCEWITPENVNELLLRGGVAGEIDLLSIDLDGNNYRIWGAIDSINPRVVVIEYQDILGPGYQLRSRMFLILMPVRFP